MEKKEERMFDKIPVVDLDPEMIKKDPDDSPPDRFRIGWHAGTYIRSDQGIRLEPAERLAVYVTKHDDGKGIIVEEKYFQGERRPGFWDNILAFMTKPGEYDNALLITSNMIARCIDLTYLHKMGMESEDSDVNSNVIAITDQVIVHHVHFSGWLRSNQDGPYRSYSNCEICLQAPADLWPVYPALYELHNYAMAKRSRAVVNKALSRVERDLRAKFGS